MARTRTYWRLAFAFTLLAFVATSTISAWASTCAACPAPQAPMSCCQQGSDAPSVAPGDGTVARISTALPECCQTANLAGCAHSVRYQTSDTISDTAQHHAPALVPTEVTIGLAPALRDHQPAVPTTRPLSAPPPRTTVLLL